MFISFERVRRDDFYSYDYIITDTDFVETGTFEEAVGTGVAVIDVYEKRNLNVAANLAIALKWQSNNHEIYGFDIQHYLNWNKEYNPKFLKYEQDIQKYLLLM